MLERMISDKLVIPRVEMPVERSKCLPISRPQSWVSNEVIVGMSTNFAASHTHSEGIECEQPGSTREHRGLASVALSHRNE